MNKKIINKANIVKIVVIIGVIIIPLMYSFFYLSAFWDPYSRLDNLPVAVVNNDTGAVINNQERNLGNEFLEELTKDGTFKYSVTNEEDAITGTEASDYYAMIMIPDNFSTDIASAADLKKQTATIVFSPNEKRNYLASQILGRAEIEMETSLRESISGEIVQNLTNQVAEVPGQLGTLNDGLTTLSGGSSALVSGSQQLASGTQSLESGTQALASGSQTLKSGTSEFASKFSEFNTGINTLKSGSDQVSNGAQALSGGTTQLNEGIQTYTAGVDELIGNVNQTSAFIASFVQAHPELMNDPQFAGFIQNMSSSDNANGILQLENAGTQLSSASETIATGAAILADGTDTLNNGIATVSGAASQLDTAADSISTGASTLANGVTTLADGATTLADGATTLADGQKQLNGGIDTAQDGVATAVVNANTDAAKLNGLSDFVSAPVTVESEVIDPIANYGTYFSPYFMSLSLWVGALIIFFGIYFDPDQKFKILSRESPNKTARSFIYLLLGLAQAILLGTIIKYVLGLEIAHVGFYFVSVCLVSMVFLAIVQFCIVQMGDLGKFVALTLLILQLTSCGGTFPIETVPKFFQVLYPFMPMTYSVIIFKDAITGAISSDFWYSFMILVSYLLVFFSATILLSVFKKKKTEKEVCQITV
ncbi:YhgE/Pip domain-containing protein [Acetobacterium bakii]|uniref:ABC-2 type transporter transmembrane domain-containing protein n=1 Tax=Acetobacterium bakii TaxID=52689 RepID=A0A0L6U2L3_9FIRM|nr:YhgE/Pip domain-containing protein [Acetobacterium bakii]KNZ42587.1 hypothetical protein AKG39_05380 [Acetobacterium bakii]